MFRSEATAISIYPFFWILSLAGAVHVISQHLEQNKKKKIFISFAIEDANLRELFVGQAKNSQVDYSFNDQSVREPWDRAWKTNCRERIQKCDAVIILLSTNTNNADGVIWEAKCALQEQKPTRVLYATRASRPKKLAAPLANIEVLEWARKDIKKFIDSI